MPAKKTAAKRVSARLAPITAEPVVDEPTGRWAQVLAETRAAGRGIDDFEVTADLVLHPPTPDRSVALQTASWAYQTALAAVAGAIRAGSQEQVNEAGDAAKEAETAYTEALFGGPEKVAAVEEYFRTRPNWEKEVFVEAVKTQFLRLPADGKCPTCKQVVNAELAGKEPASSDSSTVTGTSSRPTASNEVSTPETGPEAPDPGPSSSPIS